MNAIQQNLIVVLSLCATFAAPNIASAVAISGQGTWETTLQGRDLDGNLATFEAYYDTSLNITWLADANYARTTGYDADGRMNWATATAWAASLNPYGSGITGWRLPTTNPIDGTTADDITFAWNGTEDYGMNVSAPGTPFSGSTASEMAYLFYNTLGDKSRCDPITSTASSCSGPQAGWGLTNTGPFSNVQSADYYWSATKYALDTSNAWTFYFYNGLQNLAMSSIIDYAVYLEFYAWAVHPGDVAAAASTVPVPAAAWLFGSGLLGLIGVARRKKTT